MSIYKCRIEARRCKGVIMHRPIIQRKAASSKLILKLRHPRQRRGSYRQNVTLSNKNDPWVCPQFSKTLFGILKSHKKQCYDGNLTKCEQQKLVWRTKSLIKSTINSRCVNNDKKVWKLWEMLVSETALQTSVSMLLQRSPLHREEHPMQGVVGSA